MSESAAQKIAEMLTGMALSELMGPSWNGTTLGVTLDIWRSGQVAIVDATALEALRREHDDAWSLVAIAACARDLLASAQTVEEETA
jgi:hypothetical protein